VPIENFANGFESQVWHYRNRTLSDLVSPATGVIVKVDLWVSPITDGLSRCPQSFLEGDETLIVHIGAAHLQLFKPSVFRVLYRSPE
jgi:hypothetical protein